jgi:DNA-binding beta-propeller fold protein YncE
MADAKTLAVLKTIPVQGNPDGMLFDAFSGRVYVLSHSAPNVTVIDAKDGTVVGTIDLGGGPEQAQSDGAGHIYIDVEDKDNVAVVDTKTMAVTAHFDTSSKAGGPGGLGLDAKNHILFAMCSDPPTCVVMSATDGKVLAGIPIHPGTDGGGFNPATMEAFSSQGDGTLSIIKENSPTDFVLEQTVTTKQGAKCSTLDTKTNHIILTATERAPAPVSAAASAPASAPTMASSSAAPAMAATPAASAPAATGQRRGGRGGNNGPSLLDIIVVGQ